MRVVLGYEKAGTVNSVLSTQYSVLPDFTGRFPATA
jgi:hypothetical protein